MSPAIKQVVDGKQLSGCIAGWRAFLSTVSANSRICIIHHGDIDGIVAAAYTAEAIDSSNHVETRTVSGSDYDFAFLPQLLAQDFSHYVFLDVSVENHAASVQRINELTGRPVFIFDHHVEGEGESFNSGVYYSNPTPLGNLDNAYPIPSFLFAMRLALEGKMAFPDWLVAAALFIDGDDEFFPDDADRLARTSALDERGTPRERFKKMELSDIGNLIAADVSTHRSNLLTLPLIRAVARSEVLTGDAFIRDLKYQLGKAARAIADAKTLWVSRLSAAARKIEPTSTARCLIAALPTSHAVAGPVASIVRGSFPRDVVITSVIEDGKGLFELRTGNDTTMSLPDELSEVSQSVSILNFGGHKPAAGASVTAKNIGKFVDGLATHFTHRGFEVFDYDEAEDVFRRYV